MYREYRDMTVNGAITQCYRWVKKPGLLIRIHFFRIRIQHSLRIRIQLIKLGNNYLNRVSVFQR